MGSLAALECCTDYSPHPIPGLSVSCCHHPDTFTTPVSAEAQPGLGESARGVPASAPTPGEAPLTPMSGVSSPSHTG